MGLTISGLKYIRLEIYFLMSPIFRYLVLVTSLIKLSEASKDKSILYKRWPQLKNLDDECYNSILGLYMNYT